MKFQITFSEKESIALANLAHKFDFEGRLNKVILTKKYREGNSAGHFEYSGLCQDKGKTTIDFEAHEKLTLAACNVYDKYSYTINSIFCTVKGLALNIKSLIKNFNLDYKKELNNAFAEIETEAKMKAEAKKAEKKIREEIREKAEAEYIKNKFRKIREIEKETEADDDELY